MKKLVIGRNNACDIIIPDTTDLVSRKHAVVSVSFWGKMNICDISSNGTFINGRKLERGKNVPVSRKDKVNFANVLDFDWKLLKDPYRKIKIIASISIAFLIAAVVLFCVFITRNPQRVDTPVEGNEKQEILVDTIAPVDSAKSLEMEKGPTFTTVNPSKQKPTVSKKKTTTDRSVKNVNNKNQNNKSNQKTIEESKDKEVDKNSPIVY